VNVSNEDRDAAEPWELTPDMLKTMLYELAAARVAYSRTPRD
jgi:hypothetical protein